MSALRRLDPAIAELIKALARGDAARDFKAAMAAQAEATMNSAETITQQHQR